MVLCLNPPVRCDDVLQDMLEKINGRGKFESQATRRSIKILQCRGCRTPFCSNMNQPIEKVHRLDGTPYPNFGDWSPDPSFHHVKEGANLVIQEPRSFHTAQLSNGKSLLLQKVVCTTCRRSAGFQVFRLNGNNVAEGGWNDASEGDCISATKRGYEDNASGGDWNGATKRTKRGYGNNVGVGGIDLEVKDMKPKNNVGGGYNNIAAEGEGEGEGEGGVELEVGHFILDARLSEAIS